MVFILIYFDIYDIFKLKGLKLFLLFLQFNKRIKINFICRGQFYFIHLCFIRNRKNFFLLCKYVQECHFNY